MALRTDIHCHIIFGVDDGAIDRKTAMELLRMEYDDGVRRIIVTPHFRSGDVRDIMGEDFGTIFLLKDEVSKLYPDMDIRLGCEFHANIDMIEFLKENDRGTVDGTDYVMTEFSEVHSLRYIRERLCTPV